MCQIQCFNINKMCLKFTKFKLIPIIYEYAKFKIGPKFLNKSFANLRTFVNFLPR